MAYQYPFKQTGVSLVQQVWEKATVISGYDPNVWRKDTCGSWIHRDSHGLETQYGWEIDHVKPKALGGSDDTANLQPLQWENNRFKADNWPNWTCKNKG